MPIHATSNGWVLETRRTGYALGQNPEGLITHRYWGARLPNLADYPVTQHWGAAGSAHITPEEFPAYAGIKYIDPCLKLTFADGVRDAVLVVADASIEATPVPTLSIRLRDSFYPLHITLHYRVHEDYDLNERWVTLENLGETPINVERVLSAKWTLPPGDGYSLTHMYGAWAGEFRLVREPLTPGLKTIESRRLITSHQNSPWFAIDHGACKDGGTHKEGGASEDAGEVWFGTLEWSGNWKISAEVTEFASTRVLIGLNDWDFAWKLDPGSKFVTPPAIAGYTQGGFGAASRSLHDYVRNKILPHGHRLHPVLYNSWEATTFNVDVPSQSALAEIAAQMGVELFVMDDGWFHRRNRDNAGLGDWWPDETKFPDGFAPLIQKVNALGMDFGLWVEPEMVNPDSELYRTHPDWVIHFPTRSRSEARQQLILNFARTDVQEYILAVLDRLLSENNIAFIKWDMNRSASEPGWPDAPGDPREIWVRYVQGVYRVWGELRTRHPKVIWQSCASGGGRADLGILRLADQVWVSDNTAATARLPIQEGYSQFLPANTMEAWVTDAEKDHVPLQFRFHVSMCGALGIGGNLLHWSEADRALAADCIRQYKEIRPVIQLGDQYRLLSPLKHPYSAVQYVRKDKSESVLFVFRVFVPDFAGSTSLPTIYLRGLEPKSLYAIDGFDSPRSGSAWMEAGLQVPLGNLQSQLLRIRHA